MREIELLGRSLRSTQEGLEYEASDTHCQALVEGLGLSEESKTVNSAAVKPGGDRTRRRREMLEGTEQTRSRSLAEKEICTKMANPTRGSWKKSKMACRCTRGVEKVTWVMQAWKHDAVTADVHVDSDLGKRAQKEVGSLAVRADVELDLMNVWR